MRGKGEGGEGGEGKGREKREREGGEGKVRSGGKGKEGEESASPFPNSWIRPCANAYHYIQQKQFRVQICRQSVAQTSETVYHKLLLQYNVVSFEGQWC